MNVKEVEDTFTCDCGFSWQRGRSGKHECADGLRAKLAAAVRREEGMKAIVDVMGLRITELEQRQQQPAYPEKLPCAVHLLPGLKLGKGVATKTLLEALARRERYNAGMASMTLEQQADHEDAVNVIKAMMPAPVMPDVVEHLGRLIGVVNTVNHAKQHEIVIDDDPCYWQRQEWVEYLLEESKKAEEIYSAAVLVTDVTHGKPVTGNSPVIPDGWKLVPNEPTTKQWAAGHRAMEGGIDKVTLAYRAMVAEAPKPYGEDL